MAAADYDAVPVSAPDDAAAADAAPLVDAPASDLAVRSSSGESCLRRNGATLSRFCVKEVTSVAAFSALAIVLACEVRSDVLWWESTVACALLSCDECAQAAHCSWCAGPELQQNASFPMPGFCEAKADVGGSNCSAGLDRDACSAEVAREMDWATCAGWDEETCLPVHGGGCHWCAGSAVCVPIGAQGLCDDVGSTAPDAAGSALGLTADSPPCANSVWTDRSNEGAARLDVRPLVANTSYSEGLTCTWVLECPFNETVRVQFKRVSLMHWDELRLVDGWNADAADDSIDWNSAVLAYYISVSGDRILDNPHNRTGLGKLITGVGAVGNIALNQVASVVDMSVSVSGGRSARQAQSYGPVMTIQFKSGTSAARKAYAEHHGGFSFPASPEAVGFEATHQCATPDVRCRDFTSCVFSSPLIVWWLLAIWGLRRAYTAIFYGAKSGGLWNVDPDQLLVITKAMDANADADGDGQTDTCELVSTITQSDRLPDKQGQIASGLALSSMERLAMDGDDSSWVDVSWYSPNFLLDVIACCAGCWEGFSDILFATLQFKRPNDDGLVTGSLSLTITAFSTFMFLSPRGDGISSAVLRHFKPYPDAKRWVYQHARVPSEDGGAPRHLRNAKDWHDWLKTPTGRHRPHDLSSHPDIDYHKIIRRPHLGSRWCRCCRACCCLCSCCRCKPPSARTARDTWEGWAEFFEPPVLLPELDPQYKEDVAWLKSHGWTKDQCTDAPVTEAPTDESVEGGDRHGGDRPTIGREPGWLCGEPPTNKWDSDVDQVLYGRPPDWLMIMLTLLQLRVPVEGMIAWRNVRMLKRRKKRAQKDSRLGLRSTEVRAADFQRARIDLDKALLR